jgi:hypothetical protein
MVVLNGQITGSYFQAYKVDSDIRSSNHPETALDQIPDRNPSKKGNKQCL